MQRLPLVLLLLGAAGGCGQEPAGKGPAPVTAVAPNAPAATEEMELVRLMLRIEKSRIDGVMPPDSWPEPSSVRKVREGLWVVDIDTSRLPGGYPQQLSVEISSAGGHTGRPTR